MTRLLSKYLKIVEFKRSLKYYEGLEKRWAGLKKCNEKFRKDKVERCKEIQGKLKKQIKQVEDKYGCKKT